MNINFFKNKKVIRNIIVILVALIAVIIAAIVVNNHKVCITCGGEDFIECKNCGSQEIEVVDDKNICKVCGSDDIAICETCGGDGMVDSRYFATFTALLPPIIAILLALITKEVYSSLFIGIVAGALFNGEFVFTRTWDTITANGFISSAGNSWNAGILIFMVILGVIVALVNKAGGAKAFGEWAKKRIHTKTGASLATFALGVIIFIDDYFNCLTVGSVMRPIATKKRMSKEKLAYLIDATAAPICMIAPISSWAAAVSSTASEIGLNGIVLFCKAIPYNFYSLLTIAFIITLSLLRIEFGPMKKFEKAAEMLSDEDVEKQEAADEAEIVLDKVASETAIKDALAESKTPVVTPKASITDLVAPIISLIIFCVIGMIYSGGFFMKDQENYLSLIGAFGSSDASVGLVWGSLISLVLTIIYFIARRRLKFAESMDCIKNGFIAMVPAILILVFAWTLNGITGMLGADLFVANIMNGAAQGLRNMLPAIIFLVALGLAFATGTSWGTFGILIPIVVAVFGPNGGELLTIGISACLAGAVCGDHCSPISDTTIMASAGAKCNHINHVSTQLPYALTVAALSFVMFVLAGFIKLWYVTLPIGIALTVGTLFVIKFILKAKANKSDGGSKQAETETVNTNENI